MIKKLPVTLIILTYNEEKNIKACLDSVAGWAQQIYLVDSYSTDNTLNIARNYDVEIIQNKFENYSLQRNWALANLPITQTWVMNIDADHRVMEEFWQDLSLKFEKGIAENINGFMATRRTMFMEKWIKRGGHYPVYHGVIFRKGFGQC
jgi:glycosyltransferase involved in cell wall biosynthesis